MQKQSITHEQNEDTNTPISFNPVTHHIGKLYDTIENFYEFANVSDYIATNSDLLNVYLSSEQNSELTKEQIKEIVFMVNIQNNFIAALKENWIAFNEFTNQKTIS